MFFFTPKIQTISCEDAYKKRKDSTLIDVREKHEFDHGHAEGAINIPLSSLTKDLIDPLPKEKPLFIICQSGGRSARAAALVTGWRESLVFSVDGGTSTWKSLGLPMK